MFDIMTKQVPIFLYFLWLAISSFQSIQGSPNHPDQNLHHSKLLDLANNNNDNSPPIDHSRHLLQQTKTKTKTTKTETTTDDNEQTASTVPTAFIESVLTTHNRYRSQVASGQIDGYPSASDMNELFWDEALALIAQNHAQELASQCAGGSSANNNEDRNEQFFNYYGRNYASFDYPDSINELNLGENIGYFMASSSSQTTIEDIDAATIIMENMFNTHLGTVYDYVGGASNSYYPQHYTQMVWAKTRYLGCAVAVTSAGCSGDYTTYFFICNYYPAGNVVGEYPYAEGICSDSTCDGDRTEGCSVDSLCSGCMDPSFTLTGSISNPSDCNEYGTDVDLEEPSPVSVPTPSPTAHCKEAIAGLECLFVRNLDNVESIYDFNGLWRASDTDCVNDNYVYTKTVIGTDPLTGETSELTVYFWKHDKYQQWWLGSKIKPNAIETRTPFDMEPVLFFGCFDASATLPNCDRVTLGHWYQDSGRVGADIDATLSAIDC